MKWRKLWWRLPWSFRKWYLAHWKAFFRKVAGIPWNSYANLRKKHGIFKRDGYRCVYCGSDRGLTIDHYVPKARGGGNHYRNLVTACHRCNQTKGAAHPDEIAKIDTPNTTVTIGELMKYKEQQRRK